MLLHDLVVEVLENEVPSMATRTFTEIARLAGERDPHKKEKTRETHPGSSSAAKIVSSFPTHSKIPWHRIVYGNGGLAKQSKRRKVQLQKLQEEGARPMPDEGIQGWAIRVAVPFIGCYAVPQAPDGGSAMYAPVTDPRIAAWPPDRVEPFQSVVEAERRRFRPLHPADSPQRNEGLHTGLDMTPASPLPSPFSQSPSAMPPVEYGATKGLQSPAEAQPHAGEKRTWDQLAGAEHTALQEGREDAQGQLNHVTSSEGPLGLLGYVEPMGNVPINLAEVQPRGGVIDTQRGPADVPGTSGIAPPSQVEPSAEVDKGRSIPTSDEGRGLAGILPADEHPVVSSYVEGHSPSSLDRPDVFTDYLNPDYPDGTLGADLTSSGFLSWPPATNQEWKTSDDVADIHAQAIGGLNTPYTIAGAGNADWGGPGTGSFDHPAYPTSVSTDVGMPGGQSSSGENGGANHGEVVEVIRRGDGARAEVVTSGISDSPGPSLGHQDGHSPTEGAGKEPVVVERHLEQPESGTGGANGQASGTDQGMRYMRQVDGADDSGHDVDGQTTHQGFGGDDARDFCKGNQGGHDSSRGRPEESELSGGEPLVKKARRATDGDGWRQAVRGMNADGVQSTLIDRGSFCVPGLLSPRDCSKIKDQLPTASPGGVHEVDDLPDLLKELRQELYSLARKPAMHILNGATVETGTQLTLPDTLEEHWQRCSAMRLRPGPAYIIQPGDTDVDLPEQGLEKDQRLRVPVQLGIMLGSPDTGSISLISREGHSPSGDSPKDQVCNEEHLEGGDVVLVCVGARPASFQGGMAGKRIPRHISIRGSPSSPSYIALPFDAAA